VKKGEKGIAILAPLVYKKKPEEGEDSSDNERTVRGFKVVHVFDVTQTDGEPVPELDSVHGDPGDNLDRLFEVIAGQGIELVTEELPAGTLGRSEKGRIVLAPELAPAERFAVAVHELAHELLHKGERRQETTKLIRETEAEAVAFVVCQAHGLESTRRSADYIQLYRGSVDALSESLDFIQKTAAWVIEQLGVSGDTEADYSPEPIALAV
jgi:antirestriction protein ArdC